MNYSQSLSLYYEYLYPYQTLVQWLTYNGKKPLRHRQLSFQYQGGVVQRYVVFQSAEAMRQRMISRFQNRPVKVDAGAIWSEMPKKDGNGKTQQRQFIFDFDMNDYDDVRNCCQGKKVCLKCWKLLIVAIEIIRKTLQQDFDFHHFMFVFSGGRGVHIWICDQRARKLKDNIRKSIVDYLQLVSGNDKRQSMLAQNVLKPIQKFMFSKNKMLDFSQKQSLKNYCIQYYFPKQVQRALQIIKSQNYKQIFIEQQALQFDKGCKLVQKILHSRSVHLKNRVLQRWQKCPKQTSKLYQILLQQVDYYEKCSIIGNECPQYIRKQYPKNGGEYKNLTFIEEQIMLTFLYPRMDHNVSTAQNHLLKLPFSVHPTSHKISVPMFPKSVRGFDPESTTITLEKLIKDLGQIGQEARQQSGIINLKRQEAIQNSHLLTYINAMKDFIQQVNNNFK